MTAQPIAASVEQHLEDLAGHWLNQQWTAERETELYALVHTSWPQDLAWLLFRELAEWVRIRDGVNDGLLHWTYVDDRLTCTEPTTAAFQIACGHVDQLVHGLLGARR